MSLFPAFLKLENRLAVVIGGGSIAAQKIPSLLQAGARVRVVSPMLHPHLAEYVRRREIDWHPKPFAPDDLLGAFLVVAATSISELNASVFAEAERRNILCNSVDDIDHCHFYYGSVVQRGDLQIAISTNGKSPALAQRLRLELEEQFGSEYAAWLEWLGAARDVLRSQGPASDAETTKRWLHLLASQPSFEEFLKHSRSASDNEGVS
ncbi:MAG TPA: bifunctional precorrin-2 dehydrogenase/sirohydrochlorin ferrochelatase [Candidatus Acidoferrum sp.]